MAYVTDWKNPGTLAKSWGMPFWGSLKPTAGDFACLTSLFFDNLSTLVTFSGIWLYAVGGSNEILSGRILPACGMTLFLGNVYYAWMATRMKTQFGREFTAQPYGINTVGGFPFLFNVMGPIMWSGGTAEDAWKAGCTGNFLVGIINVVIGILFAIPKCGDFILSVTPMAALIIPVAGVGITFLAINQIAGNFATPVAGFIPVLMIFMMYYAKAPIKIGKFAVPEVLHWVIPGFIGGWIYAIVPAAAPGYSFTHPGAGLWAGGAFVQGFTAAAESFGTILPIALIASAADIMSLVSAFNAGDPYPIPETLISDGLLTIVGSILGSPFGTVIYFGHPVHKRLGGKTFYSFANGVLYLILGVSGTLGFILDITPSVAAGPTIMIFGLMLCEECTRVMPHRHHCIIFFSLFFAWADYMGTAATLPGDPVGLGIGVMKNGSLLNGMVWSCMLAYAVDRRYLPAAGFAIFASIIAFLGIIHLGAIDFAFFTTGAQLGGNNLWAGEETLPRYSTSPLQCGLAYLMLAAVFIIWYGLQKAFPNSYPQPLDQSSEEASVEDTAALNSKLLVIGSLNNWWAKGAGADPAVKKTDETATA
jgi:AGZA family xanthine/uracil permease-like MFS transporter